MVCPLMQGTCYLLARARGGQVQGNATEERIVREAGQDSGPRLWDMPPGAPTDAIEQVLCCVCPHKRH
jgi:hypothetical protein